ncbi:MAG: hypothetical protein DI536_25105 [Archangium gephyra]|uniref:Uncharacterized protein n=1 Tax=Archangium gephyra TaxID=48 RepID=A0A2W5T7Y3_9BACT|nr:MAG: hypothetical protein DI536_25105 [Archangium gephyra]
MNPTKNLIERIDELTTPDAGEHTEKLRTYGEQLKRLHDLRTTKSLTIAFIGEVGAGKTTAISRLVGLADSKGSLLPSGSGRTTLCQVSITAGANNIARVIPAPLDEVTALFHLLAESLVKRDELAEGVEAFPQEVKKHLLNMASAGEPTVLAEIVQQAIAENEPDAAVTQLAANLILRAKLGERRTTDFPLGDEPAAAREAIRKVVKELNFGLNETAPYPQEIELQLTSSLIPLLSVVSRIIDTRGIDVHVARRDLDETMRDPRTVCIFCTRFNSAPDKPTIEILRHYKATNATGLADLTDRSLVLALARQSEIQEVLNISGDPYDDPRDAIREKKAQATNKLVEIGADSLHIEVFDAKNTAPDTLETAHAAVASIAEQIVKKYQREYGAIEDEAKRFIAVIEASKNRERDAVARKKLRDELESIRNINFDARSLLPKIREDIRTTKPPTLRASTSRHGDYEKFNIYEGIASAERRALTEAVAPKLEYITGALSAIRSEHTTSEINDLSNLVMRELKLRSAKALDGSESLTEQNYRSELRQDDKYWTRCESYWGSPAKRGGRRYVEAIDDAFAGRMQSNQDRFEVVTKAAKTYWDSTISHLIRLLTE